MELAVSDLVSAKWTHQIHDEWTRNLVDNRPELKDAVARTREMMDVAIPDALVQNYELLIEGLVLPDSNDRHVLAAAIKCGAQIVVTANLKDFPTEILEPFGIEALHPDVFIEHQFGLHEAAVIACAKRIRARLQNPEKTVEEYLEILASVELPVTADKLREFSELI
jgi:hypothetical protein